MTLGPLEYVVLGFKGDRFDGTITKELEKIVEAKAIRIVDLVFINKDASGSTTIIEMDNKDDPRFAGFRKLLGDSRALFTPEDLSQLGDTMPERTAGLVILFEHRWAEDIKHAMEDRGGFLVARSVIPADVLEDLSAELEQREPVGVG
jgi:hypothetical protein